MYEEYWLDIPGYEGLYQASNLGNIRSIDRYVVNKHGKSIFKKGKSKEPTLNPSNGYYQIMLYKNNEYKTWKVHRLIALTFIPNEDDSRNVVDHINTIRTDNRVENLRWVTSVENQNNELTITHLKEAARQKAKKVICLNTLEVFDTLRDAANCYNLSDVKHLSNCCKNKPKSKSCGVHPITQEKLTWAFYEDYLNMSEEEIEFKKNNIIPKTTVKKVRCITTGIEFDDCYQAAEYYKINHPSYITKACNGHVKTTPNGLNPSQRLEWEYI